MNLEFGLKRWAAWAPGVETLADWTEWAAGARLLQSEGVPELKAMPAMLRRRLDRVGRIALQTAYDCLGESKDIPMVFASRTGETPRSVRLLQDMAQGELLSPTEFGLSVHNATGGLFTIARQDMANCTAIAAGLETLPHGLLEAFLLLEESPAVLLVLYEDVLPAPYSRYADELQQPFACSLLLTRPAAGIDYFRLGQQGPSTKGVVDGLPWGLQLLRMLAGGQELLELNGSLHRWCLEKGVYEY